MNSLRNPSCRTPLIEIDLCPHTSIAAASSFLKQDKIALSYSGEGTLKALLNMQKQGGKKQGLRCV